jgi:phage terminase large subunit-like protein
VVGVDPPAGTGRRGAACGIVAAGITEDGVCYVIADDTVSGLTPNGWAMKAIALWHRLRAEPVAALYEQGRVKHAGIFAALEDEMCDFGISGLSGGRSPDRVDALVWAIAALALQARHGPRIRAL